MSRLAGKTALVTGGSDGIGFAIAEAFATAGCSLVLVARDPGKLTRAAESLHPHGVAVRTIAVDLSDSTAVTLALAELTEPIDILVSNVGLAVFAPLAELALADMHAMIHLNLTVPVLLAQRLLPSLEARRGTIIVITSYWADKMVAGRPSSVYSATRGAAISLTRALANELGPKGIRVNAIAPGSIKTPALDRHLAALLPAARDRFADGVATAYPLGHIGQPEDVAAAALYLASSDAKWVTGVVLRVDGGLSVR